MDFAHDKEVGGIVYPRKTSSSFFQGCWEWSEAITEQ